MKNAIFTATGIFVLALWLYNFVTIIYNTTISQLEAQSNSFQYKTVAMPSPNPSFIPTKSLGPLIQPAKPTPAPIPLSQDWGVAKQLDAHTWTLKVGDDSTMATPQDIFSALNAYRAKNGAGQLSWDSNLASYAQTRANYFNSINKLDSHAGFYDFLNNQDGYNKLGFHTLGENSAIGYRLIGVHIIEWVYHADSGHDRNQLDNEWNYVGIAVNGTANDIIFAKH